MAMPGSASLPPKTPKICTRPQAVPKMPSMGAMLVTTLMVAASILAASVLVDVFAALLDPRVRLES